MGGTTGLALKSQKLRKRTKPSKWQLKALLFIMTQRWKPLNHPVTIELICIQHSKILPSHRKDPRSLDLRYNRSNLNHNTLSEKAA